MRHSGGNVPLQNFPISKAAAFRDKYLPKRRQPVRRIPRARPRPIPCTLRIGGIRSDDRFVDHGGLDEMARVVRGVAEDIERDVLPREPVRALALTEQLMALNGPLTNRSLDDGMIGMAIEEACTLWLKIARVVRESGALPKMDWVARLKEVAGQDDYGVRRAMLQQAHLLFDEPQLRAMAESQERQAVAALATEPGDLGAPDDLPRNPRVPALVLQDVAKALQDPNVEQRRHMMQDWADHLDQWEGQVQQEAVGISASESLQINVPRSFPTGSENPVCGDAKTVDAAKQEVVFGPDATLTPRPTMMIVSRTDQRSQPVLMVTSPCRGSVHGNTKIRQVEMDRCVRRRLDRVAG
jgi:hypothetical protein